MQKGAKLGGAVQKGYTGARRGYMGFGDFARAVRALFCSGARALAPSQGCSAGSYKISRTYRYGLYLRCGQTNPVGIFLVCFLPNMEPAFHVFYLECRFSL